MQLSRPGSRLLTLKCAAPASWFSWCWSRLQERPIARHGSLKPLGGVKEEGEKRYFFSSRVHFSLRETVSNLNGLYVDAPVTVDYYTCYLWIKPAGV